MKAVRIDERGATWFCHRCHSSGALSRDGRDQTSYRREVPITDIPLRWSDRAQAIWSRSQPLIGTLGNVYLRPRHCVIPPADSDLRYLARGDRWPPCLIGRITDFATNDPMSLHFTKLKVDGTGKAGTERDKILLRGHQKKGGVIRLWPDEAVTLAIGLAEGIESALSAAKIHQPMWTAIDAGNLAGLPVVDGIERITIFADHDDAGIKAGREIVTRWRCAGRHAMALTPILEGADANDVTRGTA